MRYPEKRKVLDIHNPATDDRESDKLNSVNGIDNRAKNALDIHKHRA